MYVSRRFRTSLPLQYPPSQVAVAVAHMVGECQQVTIKEDQAKLNALRQVLGELYNPSQKEKEGR